MQPFLIFLSENKIQQCPIGQGVPSPHLFPLKSYTPDQLVKGGGPAAPHGNAGGRQR